MDWPIDRQVRLANSALPAFCRCMPAGGEIALFTEDVFRRQASSVTPAGSTYSRRASRTPVAVRPLYRPAEAR